MPEVNFHDLHHSCATIPLTSGADLYTVAKTLGHTTVKNTERHAHHQVDAQRAALAKAFECRLQQELHRAPGWRIRTGK